jgi:hypothetical protein
MARPPRELPLVQLVGITAEGGYDSHGPTFLGTVVVRQKTCATRVGC